jgi:hypothetical protein
MFSTVDGGLSRISSFGTSQGAIVDVFTALMVGAVGPPALTSPLRGARRRRHATKWKSFLDF